MVVYSDYGHQTVSLSSEKPLKKIFASAALSLAVGATCAAAQTLAPAVASRNAVEVPTACAGGLVRDDGTVETGYGWIPSVVDGQYVQKIAAAELPSTRLDKVCVCWLRTRNDSEIDFDVVFYTERDGMPREVPYAAVPAHAAGVPAGIGGRFYTVDVSAVELAPGTSYVGVRWNPSLDQFFFVCADTSPATEAVEVFYIDDRARGWTSVFASADPIFAAHRAMLVRVAARLPTVLDIPVLSGPGVLLFALLLALVACKAARTRG